LFLSPLKLVLDKRVLSAFTINTFEHAKRLHYFKKIFKKFSKKPKNRTTEPKIKSNNF